MKSRYVHTWLTALLATCLCIVSSGLEAQTKTIDQLDPAGTLTGAERFAIQQGAFNAGQTVRTTLATIVSYVSATLGGGLAGGSVVTSGTDPRTTLDASHCFQTYAFGGDAAYNVTVPSASGFPVGCTLKISNVDDYPFYNIATITGSISGTSGTLTATQNGQLAAGMTLSRVGLTTNTTVLSTGSGTFTVNNSQTAGGASFTGTAGGIGGNTSGSGKFITVLSVTGTLGFGDIISGSANIPTGTTIVGFLCATCGNAGGAVYVMSNATTGTVSSAALTTTATFYGYQATGGREKTISGLTIPLLYPTQSITITANGANWIQPLFPPRLDVPAHSNANQSLRLFISPTGSSGNSGLLGAPLGTIQDAANILCQSVDLRNIDPITIQYLPGTYSSGSQQMHMPCDLIARNGQYGFFVTGSPAGPGTAPDFGTAVVLTTGSQPTFDTEMPFTSVVAGDLTINSAGGSSQPDYQANRSSWLYIDGQVNIGPGNGGGAAQLFALNGSKLVLGGGAVLNFVGDEAGNGYAINLTGNGSFLDLGGVITFTSVTGSNFSYSSLFNAAQNSVIATSAEFGVFGGGAFMGHSITADGSFIFSNNAIPQSTGASLTNGACLSGAVNTCAIGTATATTINGLTISSTTGTLSIAAGKTLTDTSGEGAVLLLGAAGGGFAPFGGSTTCNANFFVTAVQSTGATTCNSSTISGVALGSNLGTLTFGPHLSAGGSSYNGSAGVSITSDATSANTPSTTIARDINGAFSAGAITGTSGILPNIFGGSAAGQAINIFSTSSGSPSGDQAMAEASTIILRNWTNSTNVTLSGTGIAINGTATVSCPAGVIAATVLVVDGYVTHC